MSETDVSAITWTNAQSIVITDDTTTLTLQGWFLTKAELISYAGTGERIYYLELRDRRQIGELDQCKADVASYQKGFPTPAATNTWADLLTALWSEMPTASKGAASSAPSLQTTPSSYPQNVIFSGSSSWRAVCQALTACGHVPVYDSKNNTYLFVDPTQTQSGLSSFYTTNAAKLEWDALPVSVSGGTAPENAGLLFPVTKGREQTNLPSYSSPYSVSAATGITGAQSGTEMLYVDGTRAEYNTSGTLTNTTQINNRRTDFLRTVTGIAKAINQRSSKTYIGILDITPGQEVIEVKWSIDIKGRCRTTVIVDTAFDIDLPPVYSPVPTPEHKLYRYTLTSGWTSLVANATIVSTNGTTIGSSTVRDAGSVATSQTTGSTGWCALVDGEFVVIGGGGSATTVDTGRIAYTTSEITGRASGTPPTITLGKGTANLYKVNAVSTDFQATRDSPETNVTVLNLETVAIPSGRWIQVKKTLNGHWLVDWDAC